MIEKINILWICNTKFPQLAEHLGEKTPVVGGWMFGLAESLKNFNVQLTIASPDHKNAFYSNIDSYDFITIKNDISVKKIQKNWLEIDKLNKINPDIVHIHGTEKAIGLGFIKTFPDIPNIVSIQGLISICAKYYLGGIPFIQILLNITLRDIIKRDNLFQAQKRFRKRGKLEIVYLMDCKNFIGRTEWDKAHVWNKNRKANYFHCDEILRNKFYLSKKWNIETVVKHSIFLSQATYPIKGAHVVLKAINIIKADFPDLKIRIGGANILKKMTKNHKLKLSNYSKYIAGLITKYKLQENIEFLGNLNEDEMISEYLSCNLFICPSSIENSPNSLGEAQLLGVPTIASYVGGIPDMIENGKTGLLFRFEETEMLAKNISTLFRDDELCNNLSLNGIKAAEQRHNPEINAHKQLKIYNEILNCKTL